MKLLSNFYNLNFNDYVFDIFKIDSNIATVDGNLVKFNLAGFSKEQVKLTLQSGYIKVNASHDTKISEYSTFVGDDKEISDATMLNGLLTVTLKPKPKHDIVEYKIN